MLVVLFASIETAAGCGKGGKHYAEGAILCMAHQQFLCGQGGAWHKLPGACNADTQPVKTPAGKTSDTPANSKRE
jgi:hypothetical protein